MHSGRDQKQFAYGESPNTFGNCAHMVINTYAYTMPARMGLTLTMHGSEELFSSCAVVSVFWFNGGK
jgi:hypothetical protein